MGAEQSALGYPVADERNTPDALGRVSRFEHGDIVWRPDTGPAAEMHNAAGGAPSGDPEIEPRKVR
jgi:uncharacterized protein with LGFP repeats